MLNARKCLLATCIIILMGVSAQAQVPQLVNYQGRLTDSDGSPVPDGDYPLIFSIYDAATEGSLLWTSGEQSVSVADGLFEYILGTDSILTGQLFASGSDRWLGITIGVEPEGIPRTRLAAVPYAFHAGRSDTAAYALSVAGGGGGWSDDGSIVRLSAIDDSVGVGTVVPQAKLHVDGDLYISTKVTIGPGNTNTGNFGFVAGENNSVSGDYSTVGGGAYNSVEGSYATIAGGGPSDPGNPTVSQNKIFDNYGTIGGGGGNRAGNDNAIPDDQTFSTVGGGMDNSATYNFSTIGGGTANSAGAYASTIGGGNSNATSGNYSGVFSGTGNSANATSSSVGGGESNTAESNYSRVGGGRSNTSGGGYSYVGGGYSNSAGNNFSSIAGGFQNYADGAYSTVGGGRGDTVNGVDAGVAAGYGNIAGRYAEDTAAFVGGGHYNKASNPFSFVGGGINNEALAGQAAVVGGRNNTAVDLYSFVGGGEENMASGYASTIAGGANHYADAAYSTILGGISDTIIVTGSFSSLIGIGSKLTQDSTFMVDMPHVRFGDEATGYEFPPDDGTTGQVMTTDGSGQLSWTSVDLGTPAWIVIDSVIYTRDQLGISRGGSINENHGIWKHTFVNLGFFSQAGDPGFDRTHVTIGGGSHNQVWGDLGTISGGAQNQCAGTASTVGGGQFNIGSWDFATVGGGYNNYAGYDYSTIGGGYHNRTDGYATTIGGGEQDSVEGPWSGVAAGYHNRAGDWEQDTAAFVGGGYENAAEGRYASVLGGQYDTALAAYSSICGGLDNFTSGGMYSFIGGGKQNVAQGTSATVAGGFLNNALFSGAAIGGGERNIVLERASTIAGGAENYVGGRFSAILGGLGDTILADADYSYLFGIESVLSQDSTFMVDMPHIRFGDETDGYEFPVQDGTAGQVMVTDGAGNLSWSAAPVTEAGQSDEMKAEIESLKALVTKLVERIEALESQRSNSEEPKGS